MDDTKKTSFYASCYLYCQALELRHDYPSLSLIAAASSIETLIDCGKEYEKCECGAVKSEKHCKKCGAPKYEIAKHFKEFIVEYGGEHLAIHTGRFYSIRSEITHQGELLRKEMMDSGFYVNKNDEQAQFCGDALNTTRVVILNWLLRNWENE